MRPLPNILRRVARESSGFTLIETLVASVGMVAVILAMAGLVEVAGKFSGPDGERTMALREAQVGLERMVRELRQADSTTLTGATAVTARTTILGRASTVAYDCAATPVNPVERNAGLRSCSRTTLGTNGTWGQPQEVVTRVANPSVFSGIGETRSSLLVGDPARPESLFCVYAANPGRTGDTFTVEVRDQNNAPRVVVNMSGGSPSVDVVTDSAGFPLSTAGQVVNEINRQPNDANSQRIIATLPTGSAGSGTVSLLPPTRLTGGGQPRQVEVSVAVPARGARRDGPSYREVLNDGYNLENAGGCAP